MNSQPHSIENLHNRVSRLETQNRRIKQIGVTALTCVALLAIMGQTPAKKIVEANEFVLRDDSGKVRARLWVEPKESVATFQLFEPEGREKVLIDSGANGSGTLVTLSGAVMDFAGNQGDFSLLSSDNLRMVKVGDKSEMELGRGKLDLADSDGFAAAVGSTVLVTPGTGEKHITSAASVVLFDKNKNLLWRAP